MRSLKLRIFLQNQHYLDRENFGIFFNLTFKKSTESLHYSQLEYTFFSKNLNRIL